LWRNLTPSPIHNERFAGESAKRRAARDQDGVIRHAYATELGFKSGKPGQSSRHSDAIGRMRLLGHSVEGRSANTFFKLICD